MLEELCICEFHVYQLYLRIKIMQTSLYRRADQFLSGFLHQIIQISFPKNVLLKDFKYIQNLANTLVQARLSLYHSQHTRHDYIYNQVTKVVLS